MSEGVAVGLPYGLVTGPFSSLPKAQTPSQATDRSITFYRPAPSYTVCVVSDVVSLV